MSISADLGTDVDNLPVDPAEDPGVGGVGRTVGDPVGPVLRQAVLLGHRPQARPHHRHLHQDVRLLGADVVSPQCGERLVYTTIAWNKRVFYQGLIRGQVLMECSDENGNY